MLRKRSFSGVSTPRINIFDQIFVSKPSDYLDIYVYFDKNSPRTEEKHLRCYSVVRITSSYDIIR